MTTREWILLAAEVIGVIAVIMIASTSPAVRNRRPLQFKYPIRESVISLGGFALALIVAFILYINFYTPIQSSDLPWQRAVTAAVALIPFAAALIIRGQPLLSVGWGKANQGIGVRVGLSLAFITIILAGKGMNLLNGVTREEGLTLVYWMIVALAEETIFRGFIQPRLASWLGENWGWLATSALFAAWQLPHLIANPATLVLRLGLALLQGLLLGWVMRKTGHVLAPALYRAISEWMAFI